MNRFAMAAAFGLAMTAMGPAVSKDAQPKVLASNVLAEEKLLAGPGLRGRGSATPDEAIAAGYVASLFRDFGLKAAPGMDGFLQIAPLTRMRVSGTPILTMGAVTLPGLSVLMTAGGSVGGTVATFSDINNVPSADVLVFTGENYQLMQLYRAARGKAKLVIVAESETSRRYYDMIGGKPSLRTTLADAPPQRAGLAVATLPVAELSRIAAGSVVKIDVPVVTEKATTTNAIGYLAGTDPKAGVILLSAHLDHLGVRPDGTVMPGANDDASGTVAVLEMARAFAGKKMKRGILFVAYGSEEIGGLGSTWFGEHPPVPLSDIVANIEFEMIGSQDPKLPAGALMMTGSERSNMFELMKSQGARIAADPYPDQHFFERSDNYSLALKGIVAHTFSGWAVVPTYHQPTDTVENLNIPFMTAAIESLIAPIRLLASGTEKPEWKPGGQPK